MDNTRLESIEKLLNRIFNGIAVIRFPILHRPAINAFNDAQHDHTTAGNGGYLGAGVISAGLTIVNGAISLQTPGTLAVGSTNTAANSHTHAITSVNSSGVNAALLATGTNGNLTVARLQAGYAGTTGESGVTTFSVLSPSFNAGSTIVSIVPGAFTNVATGTENHDLLIGINRVVTWNGGALALQRFVSISRPTIAFTVASTVNVAATLSISGAPNAGTNATLTDAYALLVRQGQSRFADAIKIDNSAAEPAAPTNGGLLYAYAGALKWIGSSGTITTLAAA